MQKSMLKANGIHTDPNQLSVGDGALVTGENVVINRNDVIEPRRGFNEYGLFGGISDRAKQLLQYKNRILIHYGSSLAYNANPHNNTDLGNFQNFSGTYTFTTVSCNATSGAVYAVNGNQYNVINTVSGSITLQCISNFSPTTVPGTLVKISGTGDATINFTAFTGPYNEVEEGRRIRSIEANKNLYFTTSFGIKKISAATASDFTTNSGYIVDAGAPKALDLSGVLNSNVNGFFSPSSKVAYRIVWCYNDVNQNLIEGTPSSQTVVTNYSTSNSNVDLTFSIPFNVTSVHFYQVYRSAIFTATGDIPLSDITPDDELQLVMENFPTSAELTARSVTVTDVAPDSFRTGGTYLYTNPQSGQGIAQANEPPPMAKDVALNAFDGNIFYSNTTAKANTTVSLLGVGSMTSGASSVTVNDAINSPQTYTFVGTPQTTKVDFTSYTGSIPSALNGKYFLISSSSDNRKYYVWFDTTKTSQLIDFTNYIGTIPSDLASAYFVLYTPPTSGLTYYFWFDTTGTDQDPGTITGNTLAGFNGIKINIKTGVTTIAQLVTAVQTAITTNDLNSDFDVSVSGDVITAKTITFDTSADTINQTIQKGFSFTFSTPTNLNPGNNLGVYTDVVGRLPISVNVSRNVTTKADVASAVATSINNQDIADDFNVAYTTGQDFLNLVNNNNGSSTAPSDATIPAGQIGNGFAISVTTTGTGENISAKQVLLSGAASPAEQIDESARSLIRVINGNPNSTVYAYYLSSATTLPGQIYFQARDLTISQFTLVASDATTGGLFNPALPPAVGATPVQGKTDVRPNRLFYSKIQQPEAVPLLNYLDIGSQDTEIHRILALRETMFILKEDGVYRLTGTGTNYTVALFDESTKIIAPDTAVVLNNQIYCLSNQGVVAISDTGISIISKPIDYTMKFLTSSNFDYTFTSFGVSYETDRAYYLWMPFNQSDTVATGAYRYNTQTNSYTTNNLSKTCGLVCSGDDKLYLGPEDKDFIERERKAFNRTDYADRDFQAQIPANAMNETILNLSSTAGIDAGDAIIQTQYVTVNQYNQLLSKLDLDHTLQGGYLNALKMSGGDDITLKVVGLANRLDTDPGITSHIFTSSIGSPSDFPTTQASFNIIVNLLNSGIGPVFNNYLLSTGTIDFEVLITGILSSSAVELQFHMNLMEGPIIIYKAITSTILYAPETAGDPSMTKQFSQATMMFEDAGFTGATIGFNSDLSPGIETITFLKNGKGDFGYFIFDQNNWGGSGSGVPLRTLVPRQKQRCRYLQIQLVHSNAREKFSLFGVSYTYRALSERGYR